MAPCTSVAKSSRNRLQNCLTWVADAPSLHRRDKDVARIISTRALQACWWRSRGCRACGPSTQPTPNRRAALAAALHVFTTSSAPSHSDPSAACRPAAAQLRRPPVGRAAAAAAIEAADARSESFPRCRAHTLHYNQRSVALGDAALAAAALPPSFRRPPVGRAAAAAAINAADAQSESLLRCRSATRHYDLCSVALGGVGSAAACCPAVDHADGAALLPWTPPSTWPTLNPRASYAAALTLFTTISAASSYATSPRRDLKIRPARS